MKEITREDWLKNPTPRMMWVWNDDEENKSVKRLVVHCFTNKIAKNSFVAEDSIGSTVSYWGHCAEIEKPKKVRMTNYDLAKWLFDGVSCGEFREMKVSYKDATLVFSDYAYSFEEEHEPCPENILIRSNGGEWREPLVEVEE